MTEVGDATENDTTEEEALMAAWEALSKDGQAEFLSKLPPDCRAMLLAGAKRSGHQPPSTHPRDRTSSAPARSAKHEPARGSEEV